MASTPSLLAFGPISPAAPGALYAQVVAAVKREVAAGRLRPGDSLPSLRTLAEGLMVSLITVKRAYEELERDGVIYSRQGLGAFVAAAAGDQVRDQKTQAARLALREAIAAGRAAGLGGDELIDMLKQAWTDASNGGMMTHPAIELKGLRCRLGRFALGPIDLSVPRGAVVALIGPNGAGKTSMLDLIMGLGRPDAGDIRVLGMTQPADEVRIKARTAYVNPDLNFVAWGRVGRALDFVSGFYPDWDDARCERLLREFAIGRGDKIAALSFGARIKLSLIMALARDADLLLLDEPTVGLDVAARRILFAELLAVAGREERTVVISSHQMADLERFADQVIIISKGQVVTAGRMDQLLERYVQLDISLAADAPAPAQAGIRLLGREGDRVRLLIDQSQVSRADLPGLAVVAEVAMSLEDLFVALVEE